MVSTGLALVVGVLTRGINAFRTGDQSTSYRMMRYRILFQAGVVFVLLFGVFFRSQTNLTSSSDPNRRPGMAIDKQYVMDLAVEYRVDDGKPVVRPASNGAAASSSIPVASAHAEERV